MHLRYNTILTISYFPPRFARRSMRSMKWHSYWYLFLGYSVLTVTHSHDFHTASKWNHDLQYPKSHGNHHHRPSRLVSTAFSMSLDADHWSRFFCWKPLYRCAVRHLYCGSIAKLYWQIQTSVCIMSPSYTSSEGYILTVIWQDFPKVSELCAYAQNFHWLCSHRFCLFCLCLHGPLSLVSAPQRVPAQVMTSGSKKEEFWVKMIQQQHMPKGTESEFVRIGCDFPWSFWEPDAVSRWNAASDNGIVFVESYCTFIFYKRNAACLIDMNSRIRLTLRVSKGLHLNTQNPPNTGNTPATNAIPSR